MKKIFITISFLIFVIIVSAQKTTEEKLTLKSTPANLYGTLLVPENYSSVVVMIIPGSGPTDRDGNSALVGGKNNSLKYLAEDLAANGIASFRMDKRGVGESLNAMTKEKDLRFETYVNDAIDWGFQLLNDNRFKELIIIGHSEGSLIGMIATRELDVKAYISLAGTALTADSIITKQISQQSKEVKDEVERVFKQLKQGNTVDNVKPELLALFRPSVQPYLISWIKYNPSKEIEKLEIPILIIQGNTDIQVSEEDANLLHKSNPKSDLQIVDGMNHVLKEVVVDRETNMATYSNPDLKNHPKLIEIIIDFITTKVNGVK
jgi:esterase/lipase